MGRYFGTDGIRGKNERFTPQFVERIADSLLKALNRENVKILIGGDTRLSTKDILDVLATSLQKRGVHVLQGGILPTPAISYLTKHLECDCSIIVTASHNPYTDNGIKIINSEGEKLTDAFIARIEEFIDLEDDDYDLVAKGSVTDIHNKAVKIYSEKLLSSIDGDLKGIKIAVDCANGATSEVAELVFKKLNADYKIINGDKNFGTMINNNCGSTHLEMIRDLVLSEQFDYGIAYDGDGDRCLMVDQMGNTVDGDHIVAILTDNNPQKKMVITVMANQGLINWAKDNSVQTITTDVGDTNVYEEMKNQDIYIGGEQSGHVIIRNLGMHTGDGLLTSLVVSDILKKKKKSLKELASLITKYPQLIKNIQASLEEKELFKNSESVKEIIEKYNNILSNEQGRLNIRPSGTENLIRITMWGKEMDRITFLSEEMAKELTVILKEPTVGRKL